MAIMNEIMIMSKCPKAIALTVRNILKEENRAMTPKELWADHRISHGQSNNVKNIYWIRGVMYGIWASSNDILFLSTKDFKAEPAYKLITEEDN